MHEVVEFARCDEDCSFRVDASAVPAFVAPGTSAQVDAFLETREVGTFEALFVLRSNAPESPIAVVLRGVGVP